MTMTQLIRPIFPLQKNHYVFSLFIEAIRQDSRVPMVGHHKNEADD